MTTLVDTCVLIDVLRGDGRARAALHGAVERGEQLVGSVLTRTEVIAGVRAHEEAVVASLFSAFAWWPVEAAIADRAGRYAQEYSRSHRGIDAVDYVIAATADAANASLLTRNVKHFPMFTGLTSPY